MSHARALYDYDAQDSDELSFKEGDVIEVTTRAEDWSDGCVVFQTPHTLNTLSLYLSPSLSLPLHLLPTPTHTYTQHPKLSIGYVSQQLRGVFRSEEKDDEEEASRGFVIIFWILG